MEIVIATHNLHKVRELKEMLKTFIKDLDVLSLSHFSDYILPEETGKTFSENALIKARDASLKLKKAVLADDSGLNVPMLQGAPGVYSKRYAGEKATDYDNRKKLLKEMEHLKGDERAAYFECALAFFTPNGYEKCVTGVCEGIILTEEKGGNGFGYDALFMKNDYDKSFAELDESIKNRISHRYKAFEKLKNDLLKSHALLH